MIYRFLPLILFCIFSFKPLNTTKNTKNEVTSTDPKLIAANAKATFEAKTKSFYSVIDANGFSLPSFEKGKSCRFLKEFAGFRFYASLHL